MNKNIIRLGLATIAAFYVVIGGLWAIDYFPLQKLYAHSKIQNDVAREVGYQARRMRPRNTSKPRPTKSATPFLTRTSMAPRPSWLSINPCFYGARWRSVWAAASYF